MARGNDGQAGTGRSKWSRWIRGGLFIGAPIAFLGEAGHQLLDHLGHAVAHHLFHLLFGAGAVVVFGSFIAAEVRRNGWPSFSWRVNPVRSLGAER